MKAITVSLLRHKMKSFFNTVSNAQEVLIVPRNSNEDDTIVIISIKEYNASNETAYLLSTSANRLRLKEPIKQLQSGKNDFVPPSSLIFKLPFILPLMGLLNTIPQNIQ